MNFYQILGLNYNSNKELIKKTFRKLSKEHHPDRGGDEKLYQQITEAYTVLSNSNSKKEYDNLLFKKKDVSVETSCNEENFNNKEYNYYKNDDPFEDILNQFMKNNKNYMNLEENSVKTFQQENINTLLTKLYNCNNLNHNILDILNQYFPYDISEIITIWKKLINKNKREPEDIKIYKVYVSLNDLVTKKQKAITINHSKLCSKCAGINTLYKCNACYTIYKKKYNKCLECHNILKEIYCQNCRNRGKISNHLLFNIPLYKREFIPKSHKKILIKIIPQKDKNFSIVDDINLKTNYEMTLNDCIFGKNIKIKYFGSKIFNIKIPPKVPLHIPFVVKNYGLLDKTGQKRGNLLINLILKYPVISNSDSIKLKNLFV